MTAPAQRPFPWNTALTVALVIAALVAVWRWTSASKQSKLDAAWMEFGRFEDTLFASRAAVAQSLTDVPVVARPWARLLQSTAPIQQPGKAAESRELLEKFAREQPEEATRVTLVPEAMGPTAVAASLASLEAWEGAHRGLTVNPAPADGERVQITTDLGTIEIAFFPSAAPAHVANFLKLAKEGYYNGTLFHRVVKGGIHIVQGGDPNTKDGKPETWGLGGPGEGIPLEVNKLAHLRGAVAMARPGSSAGKPMSSGSQFYFVTEPSFSLNRRYTVFGTVVSGMDVVDKIAAGEIEPNADRPKNPVRITKTEVTAK